MRVLMCGGRNFHNYRAVFQVLKTLGPELVVLGGAPGCDTAAQAAAEALKIPVGLYKADWARHGGRAGPLRNKRMLAEGRPDLVVAFPGGLGTLDMTTRARQAGVTVLEWKT